MWAIAVRRQAAGGTSQAPVPGEAESTTDFDGRGGLGLNQGVPMPVEQVVGRGGCELNEAGLPAS